MLADLEGKGRRIRTVAIPIWVKKGIDAWREAAGIEKGRLLVRIGKSSKIRGDTLSDWAIWSVVEHAAKEIGIERFGAHDLRRTCQTLPQGRWGPRADQVPTRALIHPNHGTLSRGRAGDRHCGE